MNKKLLVPVIAGVLTLGMVGCNEDEKKQETTINMENEVDKISYSLGVNIGNNLKKQGLESINGDAFSQALTDVFEGAEFQVSEDDALATIQGYFQKIQDAKTSEARAAGDAFLAENAKKDGILTTASGLQYQIINEGNGPKPAAEDVVVTHYHGTTIDGEVFDSSVERGEPASFPVNRVIAGWTEALQLMPVGSKWKLFIPSDLAYGERGAGEKIGPHSALIFDVELLSIEGK